MCSSESEADPSSQACSLPGPALRTRKRSGDSSFTFSDNHDIGGEDGDNNNYPDSDDDFVIEKKKKKVEKKKRKATASNGKKSTQGLNNSNTSKSSSVSDVSIPSPFPPDAEKSNLTIEVMLKKEETSNHEEDYTNNLGVVRPVTIATPDQINSRSFDQEEVTTPSSCSTPMEENIVQKLVEQVVQVKTLVNPILKTSEELNMKTLPKPCFSSQQHTDSTTRLAQQPGQSQVANPNMPVGRGRGLRPAPPFRPGQARQPTPGTRPPVRPSGPRMLRPVRPSLPPKYAAYRPSQAVTRSGLITGGSRLPNIRSSNPIKHRSLSTPQYSSQYNPPVIELDVSPPRSADLLAHPHTTSVVNKLTSMGLSVAMEKVPTTKHGWVLPPGLSVTRTPSSTGEEDLSTSLPILAKALLQLGEVHGSKRLVQFQLTDSQVSALQALGVREDLG